MKVLRLKLQHFRNLEDLEISASPDVNVVYGDNGQGKTNLVEALWLCTGARSFRGASLPQIIGFGRDFTRITMDFEGYRREQRIDLRLLRGEKQQSIQLNGVAKRSLNALSGAFCAVVFSPAHLGLVSGGPEERRRFLDYAIGQLKPHYYDLLHKYQKCLLQRNRLLDGENARKTAMMEIWNESLAGFGAAILDYRLKYICRLSKQAQWFYEGISGGREELALSYQTIAKDLSGMDIKETAALYRKRLEETLEEDIRLGFTTVGAHRDDLQLKIGGRSAKLYASQGQKRSVVLAMKLAESEILKKTISEEPVVFLDDVLSELDVRRQAFILRHLEGKQVFITCCDKTAFDGVEREKVFYMQNGTLNVEL